MIWKSHVIVTFVTVYAITHNPVASVCAMLGSTFPDRIEFLSWKKTHRTFSHWFVFYLPVLFLYKQGISMYLFWFFIGALLHIVEDALCGKIPVFSPRKRIQVIPRLFYTGSVNEFLFVIVYCIFMMGLSNKI